MFKKLCKSILIGLLVICGIFLAGCLACKIGRSISLWKGQSDSCPEIKIFSPSVVNKINEFGIASFKNCDERGNWRIITSGNASFVPLNIFGKADENNLTPWMVLEAVSFFEKKNPNLEIVSFSVSAGPFVSYETSAHEAYVWGVWIYHKPKVKTS